MVRRSLKRRNIRGGAEAEVAKAEKEAEQALNKFKAHCEDINKLIGDAKNIYLWVIDMQYDFIDDPFEDQTVLTTKEIEPSKDENLEILLEHDKNQDLNQTLKIRVVDGIKKVEQRLNNAWGELGKENSKRHIDKGRFAVDEGGQCIEDIRNYIDLLKSNSNLNKVIFSRDVHTRNNDKIDEPNHCSFSVSGSSKGKIDGIGFPTHCVNGTVGCQLHKKIWAMVTELGAKSMVVIKGCQHNVDSFGAVPYSCKKASELYTNKRQHNDCNTKCSHGGNELPETGSYVLKKPDDNDNRNDKCICNLVNIKRDDNKVEKILDLKDSTEDVLHLVCGLAGDYCVRDTAINLKFKYPNHRVAVIADATRYPSLSTNVIQADANELIDKLHLNSHKDVDGEHFFLTAPDTLLYTYSPNFFGSDEGVLFTMDKTSKNFKYLKPPKSGRERVTPIRDNKDKYWCLSRHMYLLGKQLELCNKDGHFRSYGCYEDQRLDVIEGNTINSLGLTYSRKEGGGKRRRTRHRKGRRSKKGVARKARKKTRRHRRRQGKKSKKHW